MKYRFKHIVEYVLLRGLLDLLNLLPLRMALGVGWFFSVLFFYLFRFRSTEAQRRLAEVYGNRFTKTQRRQVAWRSFRNICFNVVETARFRKLTEKMLKQMPLIQAIKKIQHDYQKNGPLIIATAHMGNWDLAGVASKLVGLPIFSIARRQKNPLTDELLNQMRNATGMNVEPNDSRVLQNVVRRLRNGEVLAILPDVHSRTEALSIDFLGGKANLGAGTAFFAQLAHCPIYPVTLTRRGWTQHEARVFDPILPHPSLNKKEDQLRIMQHLFSIFDKEIANDPEQYFWFNKRWVLDHIN